VKEDHVQRIARVLQPDEVRQRQRDPFRRRKAIFPVKDHAVAAVEHQYRGARALVFALRHHQILVLNIDDGL
jgi:hypothetical protein